MREVVLDTETTGIDPTSGHRMVEIACLELVNHLPTGRQFQRYLHPERDVPAEAVAVHGLTAEFLADKPRFTEVADALLAFIGDAPLVIHNAEFDVRFLNAELMRLDRPPVAVPIVDTLQVARQKFPGAPASLDALCRRFAIDNSARAKHGALLDAELLAEVYLELIGGRQAGLELVAETAIVFTVVRPAGPVRPPRPHAPSAAELAAHAQLLARIKEPVWLS
jgi:DNA polymerase III subunit epsilon